METKTKPKRADPDGQPAITATARILRIMDYPVDEPRRDALRKAFGNVEITNVAEFHFGDDPVAEMLELIHRFGDVVAVELIGSQKVLAKIIGARSRFGKIVFLKAEFIRGKTGRPASVGKSPTTHEDVLLFYRYEVLETVVYVTSPLNG